MFDINVISDNTAFTIDINSLKYISKYIKQFEGVYHNLEKKASIIVYPKESIM